MCGIAGYVGRGDAVATVVDGIRRLEYRGYDSSGVAWLDDEGRMRVVKRAGKIGRLVEALGPEHRTARQAIGHSRWATHGGPTDANAHPHLDATGEVAVVHNGIVENYGSLKEALLREGHVFLSETDTEVAAHVIGAEYGPETSLEEAVRRGAARLRGAFSLVVQSSREPGTIVAVREASPLVLGFGEGENFLASDIPALLPHTREVLVMEENTVAVITADGVRITDRDGRERPVRPEIVEWDIQAAERGGHPHFMIKEIHEQPDVIRACLAGRLGDEDRVTLGGLFGEHVWTEVDRIVIVACGTAYHAGLMGKHLFERLLRLPCDVYHSSEFRYGDPVVSPRSLAIMVSQSGETADTLAALRLCQARRIRTLGIVNVVGSSIARECDRTLATQAGPEISVASTKAYTAQVVTLALVALHVAQTRETPGVRVADWVRELRRLPELARETLETGDGVREIARALKDVPLAFFLGRGADACVAYEGALKLKEVAYVPTQESPAGEMKHGPLALVEPGVVAIFGATEGAVTEKVVSNMQEVRARSGTIVAVTTDETGAIASSADYMVRLPATRFDFLGALLSVIPMQLLAYEIAALRGLEIDQPRNLAKSVTVE